MSVQVSFRGGAWIDKDAKEVEKGWGVNVVMCVKLGIYWKRTNLLNLKNVRNIQSYKVCETFCTKFKEMAKTGKKKTRKILQ